MARASKDCIFCGSSPTTKEHIWARWLRPHIPMTLTNHSAATAILNPDRTVSINRKRWGGDPRQRGIHVVCKKCNETWMSEIQNLAKPSMVPLIEGHRFILTENRQKALAAWAAMATICAEYFQPQRASISVVDRRILFKTLSAPPCIKIWIGDYHRVDWPAHWVHNALRISEHEGAQGWTVYSDGTPRSNTQTTTLVVGRLFIHTFSSSVAPILNTAEITQAVDLRLLQIWPIRTKTIIWPGPRMTDRDADNITGFIFDQLDRAGTMFGH